MSTKVYPNGNSEITVAANEKIAIYSEAPIVLLKQVGYPNHPPSWVLVYTTTAGEQYVSAAFSAATLVRVEAGPSAAYYNTGAAPTVTTPQADITAADATFTITGLSDTQGGYAKVVGGTSSTTGNAGGEAGVLGGQPGATGAGGAATVVAAAGGATSGTGGAVNITAGAGTAGNANGGSVNLTPGAKNGSGIDGVIHLRGAVARKVTVPAMTDTATIAVSSILSGTVKCTPTAAATYTMPTGAVIAAALPPTFTTGDYLDFALVNVATNDTYDITVATAASGTTMYGCLVVEANSATTKISSGIFRMVCSGAATYDIYRVT
ncbi:MAG: hypothetical protein V4631_22140 [Pseudomonadota bacterium]